MRVNVIGTRGFPNIQGGVEKHCESLYPILAEKDIDIKIFRRKPYIRNRNKKDFFHRVEFQDLWTIRNKYFETILHSIFAAIICIKEKPDVVHIHNIGPSLILPLLKLRKLPTIVTYHSQNYTHSKWGRFAREMLKIGEKFVNIFADEVIFVSKVQEKKFKGTNKTYIPNGVAIPDIAMHSNFLSKIDVDPKKYILTIGRFAPEKGLDILIKAFQKLNNDFRLVIAGDDDFKTEYSQKLKKMIDDDERIIRTGYITGESLNQIFSHARLFVLPSFQEGMPIALLEAMSYKLPVLVSDIPANKELALPEETFPVGNVEVLSQRLESFLENPSLLNSPQIIAKKIRRIETEFNWDVIAEKTADLYQAIAKMPAKMRKN